MYTIDQELTWIFIFCIFFSILWELRKNSGFEIFWELRKRVTNQKANFDQSHFLTNLNNEVDQMQFFPKMIFFREISKF